MRLLDQRALPHQECYLEIRDASAMAQAIRDMAVRGAPAIGICAAYGVVLAAQQLATQKRVGWRDALADTFQLLENARPTAVHLRWALARMRRCLERRPDDLAALLDEAQAIHREDIEANENMARFGVAALGETAIGAYTHCHTGAIACGGIGTALGVIKLAFEKNKIKKVYAGETRPWMQGARLTMWELRRSGVPVTLVADSAAATLMRQGQIDWVIVGADRIAANGDVANKIGTYSLAVAARHHGVKFMVVATTNIIDLATPNGDAIIIEQRDARELTHFAGQPVAPADCPAYNPVFDITPAALIDVLVTERGAIARPDQLKIQQLLRHAEKKERA